jgi:hypothetical protein
MSIFMIIRQVDAESHIDEWTDLHDEASSLFSQFCESVWKWMPEIATFDIWRFGGLEEPSASIVIL